MSKSNGITLGISPERIKKRGERLAKRIRERGFGDHELQTLAREVVREAGLLPHTVAEFRRVRWLRTILLLIAFAGCIGTGGVAAWFGIKFLQLDPKTSNWSDFFQGTDAILRLLTITFGGFTVFLWRSRAAARRKPVIQQLQRLTAIAQCIDEEQLDVDPDQLLRDESHFTESSPKRVFTHFSMARFLDYCNDLHALLSMSAGYLSKEAPDKEVRTEAWNIQRMTDGFRINLGRDIQTVLQLMPRELIFKPGSKGFPPVLIERPAEARARA